MTAQHRSWEDSAVQNAYPDYYSLFRCIAGRCRHNCCIGWEIDVDGDSLAAYDQIGGEMGERLRKCIDRDGEISHFILGEQERCPFLNGKNLCDLILYGGEDMLCQICTDHPRYRSFFSERTEIGVGLCCEEAARLILTRPEKTMLVTTGEGELDEEETALLTLRDRLFTLAQNREEPIERRMEQILSACGAHVPDVPLVRWAEFYLSLERMDEAWTGILEALREHADELPLDDFAAHMKRRETEYEQLLVYFLYRHVPTALDDGDVSSKAAFAVLSVRLLFSLGALYLLLHGEFTVEDQIELCRLYSAEVEYSDDNMDALFDALL